MSRKEVHSAIVTRNTDPNIGTRLRGAVFFEAPTLFEGEYPIPAEPCFIWASNSSGFFVVPKVGDEIEVEINVDDGYSYDTSDISAPEPRWRCMIYSDASDIDDIFKENYPFRMGFKSNSGHYWLMDDTSGEEFFELVSSKGHVIRLDDTKKKSQISITSSSGHSIVLDESNGSSKILIQTKGGHKVLLDDQAGTIEIENSDSSKILIDSNNLNIIHSGGAEITMSSSEVKIKDPSGNSSLTLDATSIKGEAVLEHELKSQFVKLGEGASFHATLSENVISYNDVHTHPSPQAPAGLLTTLPPTVPMSAKAGTPLDVTAIRILLRGNV